MTPRRTAIALRVTLLLLSITAASIALIPLVTEMPFSALHPERKALLALASFLLAATVLPDDWIERLVPLATATVLTLICAEFVVRRVVGDEFSTIVTLDDRLLYRMVPGAHKLFRHGPANGGGTIRISIDSLGHRAASRSSSPGTRSIIVFGDSFIEAEGTQDSSTFTEQLASRLSKHTGITYASINAGVVGHGPDQELLLLDGELARSKPALAIIGVFVGNDYGDLLRNRIFRVDSGGHLVRQSPVLSTDLRRGFIKGINRWILARLISRSRNAPRPVKLDSAQMTKGARSFVDRWLAERSIESAEANRRDTVVTNLFDDTPDVDIAVDSASVGSQYKLTLMCAVLDSMASVARARRVPLMFVLIPSAIDIVDRYDGGQVDTLKYPKYRREIPTLALANRLRERGLAVVDLFPMFRASKTNSLYFRAGDNHWNDEAQRLAAQAVADSVSLRLVAARLDP